MNFSIVITTYQRNDGSTPSYLRKALNSIFAQDYQNFKILVVDNNSSNINEK